MRYHNFNVLPHTIPYIFTQFSMVTLHYRQIYKKMYKKMYINIFFEKSDKKAWQRVANSPKPGKSHGKYMVTRVVTLVIMCSSYVNALHKDLSMFVELSNVW